MLRKATTPTPAAVRAVAIPAMMLAVEVAASELAMTPVSGVVAPSPLPSPSPPWLSSPSPGFSGATGSVGC